VSTTSTATRGPWWLGLAVAQTSLTCEGASHRLRWERGELRALDHDDAEAERTLAALGDQRCACIDMLDAWARHACDLRVLVLASRGPADRLGAGESPEEDELVTLLGLGGSLPERLAATVAAEWTARASEAAAARAQLEAALYGRVTAAVRSWLGEPGLEIELRMVDEDEPRALTRDEDGRLLVKLPFAWLIEVFARGLAITWGRFCLAAASTDGQSWTLTTLTPELAPAQTITVELPGAK
jgi:hypothetical protein